MSVSSNSPSPADALKEWKSWPGLLPDAALATATCCRGFLEGSIGGEPKLGSCLAAAAGLSKASIGNTGIGECITPPGAILATAAAFGASSLLPCSRSLSCSSRVCCSKLCLVKSVGPICAGLPCSDALSDRTDPADDRLEEQAAICLSNSISSSSAWSLSRRFRARSLARINSARAEPVEETETAAWDLSSLVLVRSLL